MSSPTPTPALLGPVGGDICLNSVDGNHGSLKQPAHRTAQMASGVTCMHRARLL